MRIPKHFSPFTKAAVEVAFEAGEFLKKGYGSEFEVSPKILPNDVVTHYDYASDDLILNALSKKFPTHSFLSEESGEVLGKPDEIRWIIDPLDGTVNFARHIPLFCVSIAACRGDEILSGAIYAPLTKEMYFAEAGLGAYLNKKKIKVSKTASIFSAFAVTSLSFNLHKNPEHSIQIFSKMAHLGFPLRAYGSAALNLAYIAAGRLDAYWSIGGSSNPWDVAAGKLFVHEAGGQVTDCSGAPHSLSKESTILATNGILHAEFIHHLKGSS